MNRRVFIGTVASSANDAGELFSAAAFDAVIRAGDVPVQVPQVAAHLDDYRSLCDHVLASCDVFVGLDRLTDATDASDSRSNSELLARLERDLASQRAIRTIWFRLDEIDGARNTPQVEPAVVARRPSELGLLLFRELLDLIKPVTIDAQSVIMRSRRPDVIRRIPPTVVEFTALGDMRRPDWFRLYGPEMWATPDDFIAPRSRAARVCDDLFWTAVFNSRNSAVEICCAIRRSPTESEVECRHAEPMAVGEGRYGYASGFACQRPELVFSRALRGNGSTLVDVSMSWKLWCRSAVRRRARSE